MASGILPWIHNNANSTAVDCCYLWHHCLEETGTKKILLVRSFQVELEALKALSQTAYTCDKHFPIITAPTPTAMKVNIWGAPCIIQNPRVSRKSNPAKKSWIKTSTGLWHNTAKCNTQRDCILNQHKTSTFTAEGSEGLVQDCNWTTNNFLPFLDKEGGKATRPYEACKQGRDGR